MVLHDAIPQAGKQSSMEGNTWNRHRLEDSCMEAPAMTLTSSVTLGISIHLMTFESQFPICKMDIIIIYIANTVPRIYVP